MKSKSSCTVFGFSARLNGEADFDDSTGYFMWKRVGIKRCIKLKKQPHLMQLLKKHGFYTWNNRQNKYPVTKSGSYSKGHSFQYH